ncbi:uncharacterized protein LOC130897532 isoform X2 [Diorhabda carinulata]|uniref:uncharacterized protein LOC130897532 isoform X2 n=1 Tax=Diorhabda carinulata TaxID=1163345 RepID=UPI0025A12C2D|nr:uncharacterized protein LOC130897532 isoform X2 [Diorhabda carinulata]
MAITCWAPDCCHNNMKHVCKFYRFPLDSTIRKMWLTLLRDAEPGSGSRVCSCHFREGNKNNLPEIYSYDKRKLINEHHFAPELMKKGNKCSPLGESRQGQKIVCWAPGCDHNNMREKCNYFRFPQEDKIKNKLTRSTASPDPEAYICSCHFADGKKENGPSLFECNVFSLLDKTTPEKNLKIEGHIQSSRKLESITVCAVPGCTSMSSDKCLEFFPFPQSKMIRYKWIQFCGVDAKNLDTRTAHICCKHFEESSYITKIEIFGDITYLIRALCYDAVPVINNPNTSKISVELQEDHQGKSDYNSNVNQKTEQLVTKVYGDIKTQADLHKLKIYNELLKKKNKLYEINLKVNQKRLKRKEALLASLESQVSKTNILYGDVLAKVFSQSQIKHLCGHKKTHWTEDDLAVGFTIRYLSSRTFYNYLTNTLKFPLPALSTIQRYIVVNKKKSGGSGRSLLKNII